MPLAPGQLLSFYELLAPLGAGGMGEVWRAHDTRLGRQVAIKVRPEHFAEDEDRLRRFEREARTMASLNHPNIAGVYGIDQVGDTCSSSNRSGRFEIYLEPLGSGPVLPRVSTSVGLDLRVRPGLLAEL